MSAESEQPNSKSRRQLRFNNYIQEQEYQPESDEDDSPLRSVPDENIFRVPLPPINLKSREPMIQKTNTFANNFEHGLDDDDGTKAKYLQKMKQLEERRAQSTRDKKFKKESETVEQSTNKLDISLTEQSFLSAAHSFPNPVQTDFRLSNISSIHPFETTFTQSTENSIFGPVSSTPFRETVNPNKKSAMSSAPILEPVASTLPSSSNFLPANDVSIMYETYEEKLDRQMKALTVWCNIILKSDLDVAEIDLGKSKKEADQKLQDLLTKPSKCEQANQEVSKKFSYKEFLKKQERDAIMEKAMKCYRITNIPIKIREMVNRREVAIRDDCGVYCNISLMKTLLRVFLSFNPVWLHLGLEIVFNEKINIGDGEQYASVLSKFISSRLFTDPAIMKNKKFALGTVKMIVTPAGREALHAHFLTHACQYLFFVEYAKSVGIFEHNPRMFNKSSTYKCLEDVFSELSREVLSASSLPLHKAMAKVGFKPKFKQGFLDNFDYKVTCFNNFCDGIVLGKLIEIIYHVNYIGAKLREPKGDRLRKVGNIKVSFEAAKQAGLDLGSLKPDAIVAGNKEAILELLWRLVGVYVLESRQSELRRLSMDLENRRFSNFGCANENTKPDELVLHICRQIGDALGLYVECIEDLKDGRLLAGAWRMYNPQAPDVTFYPGNTLYKQVVAAAESELDVPLGLQGAVQLFAYMYLTRLFDHHKIHSAASRIQKAYRSYKFLKFIKTCATNSRSSLDSESYNAGDVTCDVQRTYIIQEDECVASFSQMSLSDANALVGEVDVSSRKDALFQSAPDNEEGLSVEVDLDKSARKIQAVVRSWLARRKMFRLKEEREAERLRLEEEAAIAERQRLEAEVERVRLEAEAECLRLEQEALQAERLRLQEEAEQLRLEEETREIERLRLEEEAERLRLEEAERVRLEEEAERLRLEEEAERLRLEEEAERLRLEEEAERLRLEEEAERLRLEEEAERLRLEEEAERIRLEEEAERIRLEEEAERLRLEEEAERLRLEEEAERVRLEEEAERLRLEEEAERLRLEEVAERLRLEEEAREAERLRLEEEAREAERLRLEEEAREAERLRLEEEAREAERLRLEEEAREAERLRLEEEAREAERLRLEEVAREAERLRLEEEAREAERLRLEEEAREAERLRLEEEAREAERLRLEAEAREAERLRLEAEAREAERLRLEAEAREAERLRLEAEAREAERLRLEKEAREAERLRLEEEAREAERLRLEEEARQNEIKRLHATVTLQAAVRGLLTRRKNLISVLRGIRLKENSATVIQAFYRGWKARKVTFAMKQEKNLREALEAELLARNAAVTIQKHYRGWIARRDSQLAKETYQQISSDKSGSDSGDEYEPDENKVSLRFIYESVRNLRREQKTIAKILEVLKLKQEQKNSALRLVAMGKAAAKIQCWYRGERIRKIYKEELIKRQKLMQFYSQTVSEHNGEEEGFRFKSARERLSLYSEYLFHDRMYAMKVGAHGINRLTSLIPYFIVEFVESLQGVAVILDAIENLDRGVSSTEILVILSEILASITKCRDVRVHKPLCEHGEDCVKIMFHIFHAHYKNTAITKNAAEGLVALYERPDFKPYFVKLPFYLKSAQRRFEKYPSESQEAKNLRMLQSLIN